jgi:hypothetical protein
LLMGAISADALDCGRCIRLRAVPALAAVAGRAQPKSPALTPRRKASHSASVKISAGPSGNLEFRTATPSARRRAASTQLPLGLLKLLLCHATVRSSDARTQL